MVAPWPISRNLASSGSIRMSNQQSSKGSTSQLGSTPPAWATPGTEAYNNNNQMLATAPMGVANQTFAQGGMGQTAQQLTPQLAQGSNFQNIYNQAGQPGAAQQYLSGTAGGEFLNGSPYLNDIITQTNQKVGDSANALFAGSGRYGSGAHQGVLSDSIASNTSNLLNQNYQQERDRQLQAAGAISGEQQGRLGQQLGAASGLTQSQLGAAGLENQGFQNMLGMISQLPTIQGNKTYDANQQMQVGGQIDQAAQNQLNDLISQWQKGDQEDWSRLGGLISGGIGSAGNYGTQSGTSTSTSQTNPLQIAGLLGSLFFSDRRLKSDIVRVGETTKGFPVYEYTIFGNRQIGVMADEVEAVMPEAVVTLSSGYKMVRYDMVGSL